MTCSEALNQNKFNKFTFLKRQKIIRRFWRSAKSDEIIFISAPMLYGKTTAAITAMEELHKEYLHICFDSCMNNSACFCGYMLNRLEKISDIQAAASNQDSSFLLTALGKAKKLNAIIFDDFQFCKGNAVSGIIKSIYKLYGADIQIIILSRGGLPKDFSDLQYENKIITINEEDLSFSAFDIKKLAEQNNISVNTPHARCLSEKCFGCIGFIEEELRLGEYIRIHGKLTGRINSHIENAVSNCGFLKTLELFAEFAVIGELPKTLLTELCGDSSVKKTEAFIRETGLVKENNSVYIPHPILKSYIKNIKKKNPDYNIYNFFLSKSDYNNALKYAAAYENRLNTEDILYRCLNAETVVSEDVFEKIYEIYKNNPFEREEINYFLLIFKLKAGEKADINLLITASEKYKGIKTNLKAHVFTSVYPHINNESGLMANNEADRLLFECGSLYEEMKFSEAFNALDKAKDICLGEFKPPFFCLLINTLRSLFMYTAAENELLAFEKWVEENPQFYSVYESFRAETAILSGDADAAREWLSADSALLNTKIYRSNINRLFISALASVVIGENDAALYRLKNIVCFAEKTGMHGIRTESLTLLAIICQEKNQTEKAVCFMEKALEIAGENKKIMHIGKFGRDVCFLTERCCLRAKKKNINNTIVRELLLYIKNENICEGFLHKKETKLKLSERQRQMLEFLSEGCTYNQIAESTGIKITTVRDHIKKLYEKLEVRNATDAAVKAKEKKLI